MIDINQYRCHIGLFRQRIFRKKFLSRQQPYKSFWKHNLTGVKILFYGKFIIKLFILCVLIHPPTPCSWSVYPSYGSGWIMPDTVTTPWTRLWQACPSCSSSSDAPRSLTWTRSWQTCPSCSSCCCTPGARSVSLSWSALARSSSSDSMYWSPGGSTGILQIGWGTGNFWAKYINGNKEKIKGIHNMHFNIRSLRNKVDEVKNIVYTEKPTILGLSECELKKENLDPKMLKIPGYEILYPKSWELQGFARIIIYVK